VQADKYKIPRIVFVNKMDKIGADFLFSVNSLENKLGAEVAILQLPIFENENFIGIVDVIEQKAYQYDGQEQEIPKEINIPEAMKNLVLEYRGKLFEKLSDRDEEFAE
jgi:elongation factor G